MHLRPSTKLVTIFILLAMVTIFPLSTSADVPSCFQHTKRCPNCTLRGSDKHTIINKDWYIELTNNCDKPVYWNVCIEVHNDETNQTGIPDRQQGHTASGEVSKINKILKSWWSGFDQHMGPDQHFERMYYNINASVGTEPLAAPCIASVCMNFITSNRANMDASTAHFGAIYGDLIGERQDCPQGQAGDSCRADVSARWDEASEQQNAMIDRVLAAQAGTIPAYCTN